MDTPTTPDENAAPITPAAAASQTPPIAETAPAATPNMPSQSSATVISSPVTQQHSGMHPLIKAAIVVLIALNAILLIYIATVIFTNR